MSNAIVRFPKDGRCCRSAGVRRRGMVGGGRVEEQTPPHLAACHRASHLLVSSAVLELQPHPLLRTAGTEPPSGVCSHPQQDILNALVV